jgi:hypothetical protein
MPVAKDVVGVENCFIDVLQHIPGTKEAKQAYFKSRGISVPRTNYDTIWGALTSRLQRSGAASVVFDLLRSHMPVRLAELLRQARRGKSVSLRGSEPALVDDLFFQNGNLRRIGELYLESMGADSAIRVTRRSLPEAVTKRPVRGSTKPYEIALSFAGQDRPYVEQIASTLQSRGVRVFYDSFEQVDMLGKDLTAHLADVYKNRADYCAMFISQYYAQKAWPQFERQHAQSRALAQKREYILPIRLDDCEVPGLPSTICFLDARRNSIKTIADTLIEKIRGR